MNAQKEIEFRKQENKIADLIIRNMELEEDNSRKEKIIEMQAYTIYQLAKEMNKDDFSS